jgi:hypothetical protein
MLTPACTARLWMCATLTALALMLDVAPARAQCVGDCDGGGTVDINELILGVNIAQGNLPLTDCPSFDCDHTGSVPINCLIQGVNNALNGCPVNCPLAAGAYTITQTSGGTLNVSTLSTIAFPPSNVVPEAGSFLFDVGPGNQDCIHNVVVPFPGGLTTPNFCVPVFGFTVKLTQNGCGIGQIASNGGADYTIQEVGDTSSEPICNNQQACNNGVDSKVRVDVTVGDGVADTCPSGSANAVVTIPVRTLSWLSSSAMCPASQFNPDTDLVVLDVNQILDLTTDTNRAQWMDLSGDGCSIAGSGPAAGLSSTGSCMNLSTNTVTLAASGTVGSQNTPLFDFTFTSTLPNSVSAPNPPLGATCDSPPAIDFTGTVTRCLE